MKVERAGGFYFEPKFVKTLSELVAGYSTTCSLLKTPIYSVPEQTKFHKDGEVSKRVLL